MNLDSDSMFLNDLFGDDLDNDAVLGDALGQGDASSSLAEFEMPESPEALLWGGGPGTNEPATSAPQSANRSMQQTQQTPSQGHPQMPMVSQSQSSAHMQQSSSQLPVSQVSSQAANMTSASQGMIQSVATSNASARNAVGRPPSNNKGSSSTGAGRGRKSSTPSLAAASPADDMQNSGSNQLDMGGAPDQMSGTPRNSMSQGMPVSVMMYALLYAHCSFRCRANHTLA